MSNGKQLADIEKLKLDIAELNALLETVSRKNTKDMLEREIMKVQLAMSAFKYDNSVEGPKRIALTPEYRCHEIKLDKYSFDQTNLLFKLYIQLDNVHNLPSESVKCNFTERSLDLHVTGLENKNYGLVINNLCEKIKPEASYVKVKTNMIMVILSKATKALWPCVTIVEKQLKESKSAVPEMNDVNDPNGSLMSLMKKMYQNGDDEMKKTIAKAWTECREKKGMDPMQFNDM